MPAIVDTTPPAERRGQQRGLLTCAGVDRRGPARVRGVWVRRGLDSHDRGACRSTSGPTDVSLRFEGRARGGPQSMISSRDSMSSSARCSSRVRMPIPCRRPRRVFAALVRAVSRLPELNRIMVHEATADSERLTWIVDTHVRCALRTARRTVARHPCPPCNERRCRPDHHLLHVARRRVAAVRERVRGPTPTRASHDRRRRHRCAHRRARRDPRRHVARAERAADAPA